MDVKIAVAKSMREISFETDLTAEKFMAEIEKAEKADADFVSFTDTKENQWHIRTDAILFIEFGSTTSRKIGFVN